MTKYIELEAAVKAFNNFDAGRADSPPCTLLTPEEFAEYLYELPAADVAPVVHARWITRSDKGIISMTHPYMCSRCWRVEMEKEPYCNCGAKMDEGEKQDGN